jgi:hypothetical protein
MLVPARRIELWTHWLRIHRWVHMARLPLDFVLLPGGRPGRGKGSRPSRTVSLAMKDFKPSNGYMMVPYAFPSRYWAALPRRTFPPGKQV